MRLLLAVPLFLTLACAGFGDMKTEAPPAPVAPTEAAPAVWELTRQDKQELVKAGVTQGLAVGSPVVLLGPPLAGTENRQIVGSATVAEVWPDLARVTTDLIKRDVPPPEAARAYTPADQAALDAISVSTKGGGGATRAASAEPAAPTTQAGFTADQVPVALRSGSSDSREDALVRYETDDRMTNAIVWVMKNDDDAAVRFKAWRVVRARWKRGTGVAAEHEAAAVWAAANTNEDTRIEALAAIGERSRSLNPPARHLADASERVRIEAGAAIFEIGGRTGKRTEAKKLLSDRLEVESVGSVRKRLDGWIDEL